MPRKRAIPPPTKLPLDDETKRAELSYLNFLLARGVSPKEVDPLSDDGLRLQALYVQHFSQHPLDVIRQVMENVFSDPKDRLNAAKTLMEYSLRKPTTNLAVTAKGAVLSIDPASLSALSVEELEALDKMLAKVNG